MPPACDSLLGGSTAAGVRMSKGCVAGCRGRAEGMDPPTWALCDTAGAGGSGMCSGGSAGSAVAQFTGMLHVLHQLWLFRVSHSSAVSIPAGAGVSWGAGPALLCQPLGLAEELCSSSSSFLGILLQLSGALMLCLAPCQNPACTWVRGPLAADPPVPRESQLPPSIPSSSAPAGSAGAMGAAQAVRSLSTPGALGPHTPAQGIMLMGQGQVSPVLGLSNLGLALPWGHPPCAPLCWWDPACELSKCSG